jgi:hypothetical protein
MLDRTACDIGETWEMGWCRHFRDARPGPERRQRGDPHKSPLNVFPDRGGVLLWWSSSAVGIRSQVFLPGSYRCQGRLGMRPQASDRNDECLYLNSINPDVQTAEVVRIENAHGDESIASGMAKGCKSRTFAETAARESRTHSGAPVLSLWL